MNGDVVLTDAPCTLCGTMCGGTCHESSEYAIQLRQQMQGLTRRSARRASFVMVAGVVGAALAFAWLAGREQARKPRPRAAIPPPPGPPAPPAAVPPAPAAASPAAPAQPAVTGEVAAPCR